MKIIIALLTFVFCNLSASQFFNKADLEASLKVTSIGMSVGTVFATTFDTKNVSNGEAGMIEAGTCFAIGKRHLLTSAHQFKDINPLRDCFVSMETMLCQECERTCNECSQYPTFLTPSYRKVIKTHYGTN